MATVCRVMLPNPYFTVGSYVELSEDGAQEVEAIQENGRLRFGAYKGLVIPENLCRKYLFKILARGFDDVGAYAELKGRYKENPSPTNEFWEAACEAGLGDRES